MHWPTERGDLGVRLWCNGSNECVNYLHEHYRHVDGIEYCKDTKRLIINLEAFPNVKGLSCRSCARLALITAICDLYSRDVHGFDVSGVVIVGD